MNVILTIPAPPATGAPKASWLPCVQYAAAHPVDPHATPAGLRPTALTPHPGCTPCQIEHRSPAASALRIR